MEKILSHISFLSRPPIKIKLSTMHIPVLLNESIEGLNIKEGGIYVDCTTNRGGHSIKIAKALKKGGTLICIDLDKVALKEAEQEISKIKNVPTLHFIHSNFRHLPSILKELGVGHVDGILADLGLSSQELDESKRGFSFRFDEPLLMTYDSNPSEDVTTAFDIVNYWSESTIADILYGFSDETYRGRIASAIVKARIEKPIKTTFELVDIIAGAVPTIYRHKKTHFATKTFQALRMAANDELGSINDLIASLPNILASNGRACIITFHSTEDRIVKQGLRANNDTLKAITKKAIIPQEKEINENPRARSAQLRIVERI
ncbi:16S rRNA (cytosine(1402)-N(4))-methyltransferase RsmH [Candidatus Gracilibacteria bacterium]|nr:16S rRNA (cytosine(1402)-N(4))-methyltransferase RsmH [Candidatus Gracilibacteria bacterium]MCF7898504.1 16S rRNA (cytosine(1402)-N(4))-methyltransferase RsmH [Candidatus Paceibacterota bacterium]